MSTEIRLPAIGFSTQQATLLEFLVADGETVKAGQPLYTLELDKSVQEIDAPSSGILKIRVATGQVYPVGTLLGEIV